MIWWFDYLVIWLIDALMIWWFKSRHQQSKNVLNYNELTQKKQGCNMNRVCEFRSLSFDKKLDRMLMLIERCRVRYIDLSMRSNQLREALILSEFVAIKRQIHDLIKSQYNPRKTMILLDRIDKFLDDDSEKNPL